MNTARTLLAAAGALGFIGVAAGAFGAHALKARLSPDLLAVFETGSRYQLVHAAAMLAAGVLAASAGAPSAFKAAGWLWAGGIVVFSGSLYVLALTGVRAWGAVTPVGGLQLLAGWAAIAWGALRAA
jgi:uncharacterized membrane protein YgdD (TMEM256/DUF423 family)